MTELEVTWIAISSDLFIAANATVESQSNFNLQVSLVYLFKFCWLYAETERN